MEINTKEPKFPLRNLGFARESDVKHMAPLTMGFPRQKHWSGLPFSSPENLPEPGIESRSPALQAGSLPTEPPGKPQHKHIHTKYYHCLH